SRSTTMTGTVLPDGSVGPVNGIGEKLKAAAAAGFTRVLIPTGERLVSDPSTGRSVDASRLGRRLGVQVTAVSSVRDAYVLMSGRINPPSVPRTPPIQRGVLRMLVRRSRALIAAANREVAEVS